MVYTTISLPHISLEINRDYPHLNADEKLAIFKEKWCKVAEIVKDQLFDRYNKICKIEPADLPCNEKYALWLLDFTKVKSMEDVFKNGTLSIGFIGLSEAFELIFGEKYFASEKNHEIAINLVKFMREIVDGYRKQYHMNFTLLATSGEFISGRFPNVDIQTFQHPLIEKGFYTNSFHVDVDSGLNPFDSLKVHIINIAMGGVSPILNLNLRRYQILKPFMN
jgi:ribonucleoside-triphosphate reductase